jgi:hydroxyacylglutathione hydrolase
MIHLHSFVFNPLQENTYLVWDDNKECIIIDPGCYEREEKEMLAAYIKSKELLVKRIVNTHCHIDHILGNTFVKAQYKVKLAIPRMEEHVLKAAKVYAPNYGFAEYSEALPDQYLEEREFITFGKSSLKVILVPGHSPGHVAFYNDEYKICIAGDVLFKNSIGRTDLPGGDYNTLIRSIKQKLFILDDKVKVYPGHGPHTTIGDEKKFNPFLTNS